MLMKTFTNLLLGLFSIAIAAFLFTGCDDDDVSGDRLTELTYSDGEVALGQTYVSAQPSVYSPSTPSFAVTRVKHNGAVIDDQTMMSIDASTGVITAAAVNDQQGLGEYLVSVRVTNDAGSTVYDDVFRLVVKGILFGDDVKVTRGEKKTFSVEGAYFVQEEGTVFSLVLPEGKTEEDYKGISLDPETCALTVDETAEAGFYPISVSVKNLTNSSGTTFSDLTTLIVESEPYDLAYAPAQVTLVTSEGHTSAVPTVKAASQADGLTVTYALANNFDNQFSIDPATGVISLPEDNALPAELKSYKLSVEVTNSLGTTTFTDIYEVILDPDKPIDPITAVTYPDAFPVELGPGEAWTSGRPTVTGAAIGVRYELVGAPQGVTIDNKTGIISFAAGHRMPFAEDNKLTVSVKNSGMDEGFEAQVGDFFVNPVLWTVVISGNNKDDALVNSGIGNMDRYSYMGPIMGTTSSQVKLAWGKSSSGDYIDYVGSARLADNATLAQNNDWLVSEEIEIPDYGFNPAVMFDISNRYGSDVQNLLELYIVEINASNVYLQGEEEQNGNLDSKPSSLPWELISEISPYTVNAWGNVQARVYDIPAQFKGKTIRFALRYYNPSANQNNTRTYRIQNLRVEDHMTE